MNRRAFPVCAGGLTLLAAIAGAYLADDLSWPATAQAPRLLPTAPHAARVSIGHPDEPPVLTTGLIQPAIPPGTRKQSEPQPAPITAADPPGDATPLNAAKPAAAPVTAPTENETRFLQGSVSGSVSPILAPKTVTNLVTRHKTQLATPLITPALAPAAQKPAVAISQPAVEPKQAVAPSTENKLRVAAEEPPRPAEPPVETVVPQPEPEEVAVEDVPQQEAAPPESEPSPPQISPRLQSAPLSVAKSVPAQKVRPAEKAVEEASPQLAAEPAPLAVEPGQPETLSEPAPRPRPKRSPRQRRSPLPKPPSRRPSCHLPRCLRRPICPGARWRNARRRPWPR